MRIMYVSVGVLDTSMWATHHKNSRRGAGKSNAANRNWIPNPKSPDAPLVPPFPFDRVAESTAVVFVWRPWPSCV